MLYYPPACPTSVKVSVSSSTPTPGGGSIISVLVMNSLEAAADWGEALTADPTIDSLLLFFPRSINYRSHTKAAVSVLHGFTFTYLKTLLPPVSNMSDQSHRCNLPSL